MPSAVPLPGTRRGPGGPLDVLFLHGFMGAAANWAPVRDRLAPGLRSLAVDLPGHGAATDRPPRDYTMEGAAACLAATLRGNEADRRPVVVGYSMGGRLALYFALAYPDCCRGLVLESASPGLQAEDERAARRRTDAQRAGRLRADFRAFLDDWYRMPLFASLAEHGLVEDTIARRMTNAPGELARALVGMSPGRQPPLWERLADLPGPALVLAGALDAKYCRLTEAMADRAAGRLRRIVVAGAGHNVHAERPARFATLLTAFLNSSCPADASHD